jgi:hypothetical protein
MACDVIGMDLYHTDKTDNKENIKRKEQYGHK